MIWLAYFRPAVSWRDIVRATWRELGDDRCTALAAQLAFYFLLSLFPALLFVVALVGYLPIDSLVARLLIEVGAVAPQELVTLLRRQLEALTSGSHRSLLTLGVLGAVWSSSAALVSLIDALNQAYDLEERRPWWRRRIVAILLTLALVVFALTAITGIIAGPALGARIAAVIGITPAAAYVWQVIRWPLIVACVVTAVDLVYHFAPNRAANWAWITPGGVLATLLWIASSTGFKYYVAHFGNYAATYGAIGAAIVTMLWFYLSGLALLAGAELNAVIERAGTRRAADDIS